MKPKAKRTSTRERALAIIEIPESESGQAGIYVPLTMTQMFMLIRAQERKFNSQDIYKSIQPHDGGWTNEMMHKAIIKEKTKKERMNNKKTNLCLGAPVYVLPPSANYPWNATVLVMSTAQEEVIEVMYELGFLDLYAVNPEAVKYEATVVSHPSNTSDLLIARLPIIMANDSNLPKGNSTTHGLSALDYLFFSSNAAYHMGVQPHNPVVITNIQPLRKFRQ